MNGAILAGAVGRRAAQQDRWWGTCLYANEWKYWTMGRPVENTILINRTNQEVDGRPLRRPDRGTLEALGATEMMAHLERQGLVARRCPARA